MKGRTFSGMEKANDLDEDYVSFCSEGTGEAICESCK